MGLGGADDDAFARVGAGASKDLEDACGEVNGGPLEGKDFALAEACFEGDHDEGCIGSACSHGEEAGGFAGAEGADFVVFGARGCDSVGRVALGELPLDGLAEGFVKDVVVLEDGARGKAFGKVFRVSGLDVGWAEVDELYGAELGLEVAVDDAAVAVVGGAGEVVEGVVAEPAVEVGGEGEAFGAKVEAGVALVEGIGENAFGIAAEALNVDGAAAAPAGDGIAAEFEAGFPGGWASTADATGHGQSPSGPGWWLAFAAARLA